MRDSVYLCVQMHDVLYVRGLKRVNTKLSPQ